MKQGRLIRGEKIEGNRRNDNDEATSQIRGKCQTAANRAEMGDDAAAPNLSADSQCTVIAIRPEHNPGLTGRLAQVVQS